MMAEANPKDYEGRGEVEGSESSASPVPASNESNDEPTECTATPETATSDEKVSSQSMAAPDPGPAFAVLAAMAHDAMPGDNLGPDTVPAKVLAHAVRVGIDQLIWRRKTFKKTHGPAIPRALRTVSQMRADKIRRHAPDQIYKTLWMEPQHPFVAAIRTRLLEKHADVAAEVRTGALLHADRMSEFLAAANTDAIQTVTAVLWAMNFDAPGAKTLFRVLTPLLLDATLQKRSKAQQEQELRSVESDLRHAQKAIKQAEKREEEQTRIADLKRRALEKLKPELEAAVAKRAELASELAEAGQRLCEVEGAIDVLRRDAEVATKTNAQLRVDLSKSRVAMRALELQRSDLVRELAEAERENKHLQFDLDVAPQGAHAFWEFLKNEDQRIQNDRLIVLGEKKEAAELQWSRHRKLEAAFLEAYPEFRQPPPKKIRPKSKLRFVALGGSSEVGGSCYLVELGSKSILVDCGIRPRAGADWHPVIGEIQKLDALILTHAHADHVGWVAALVRRFPSVPIYCSEGTAALLPVMLEDSLHHYTRKLIDQRERAAFIVNATPVEEAYGQRDIDRAWKLAYACPFESEEPLPFEGAWITFFRAGHILGAASVLIKDDSGRRIFFSGDFASFDQLTVPAARWPQDLGEVDLLVLESTYAGKPPHSPLEQTRLDLERFIAETTGHGGSVILASFALGRAQELLSAVTAGKREGRIPSTVPVHADGLIRQLNPIYRKHATFNVEADDFNEVMGEAERREVAYEAQLKPTVIVTTSGMMTGGPVIQYSHQLLGDVRHRIVFAGYQDEGAPSREIIAMDQGGRGGRWVDVHEENGKMLRIDAAAPAKHFGLSSHADEPGLLNYAARLKPGTIALVHGYPEGQRRLATALSTIHPRASVHCGPSEIIIP